MSDANTIDPAQSGTANIGPTPAHDPIAPPFASDLQRIEYQDAQDRQHAHLALADWQDMDGGVEYAANMRLINRHLDRMPAERRAELESGRNLNNPEVLRQLAAEAREAPAADLEKKAEQFGGDERKYLESLMRDRGSEYWRGPMAEELQAAYRDRVRLAHGVREWMDANYPKDQLERDVANFRTHRWDAAYEAKYVAEFKARGGTANEAFAVLEYLKSRA